MTRLTYPKIFILVGTLLLSVLIVAAAFIQPAKPTLAFHECGAEDDGNCLWIAAHHGNGKGWDFISYRDWVYYRDGQVQQATNCDPDHATRGDIVLDGSTFKACENLKRQAGLDLKAQVTSTAPSHPVQVTFAYPKIAGAPSGTYTAVLSAWDLTVKASNRSVIYVTIGSTKWGVVYHDPNCWLAC